MRDRDYDLAGFFIALRAKHRWTQTDLARQLGVKKQTVHGVEQGLWDMGASRVLRLLERLGEVDVGLEPDMELPPQPDESAPRHYNVRDREAVRRLAAALDAWLKEESESRAVDAATDLGPFMRQLREAQGWTRREMAERLGVRPNHVSGIEHGDSNMSGATLLRLLHEVGALNVQWRDRPDYTNRDKEAAYRLRDALAAWLESED